jgi:HTH-type transcriptional regulator/antitoxin HigA
MVERIPAEVFPPGEIIKEELDERGWTQAELADIMGRPPRVVSEIIAGKRAITPETAKGLAAAFGTGATLWINLEGLYQLSKTAHDDVAVQKRALLYAKAPIKEMIKRNWIRSSDNVAVLETQVLNFLEIHDISEQPRYAHAARKGKSDSEASISAQWAWFYRVRQIAKSISVPKYSEKALRDSLDQLKGLLLAPEEARHVSRILTECGVRFVITEKLPHADIDGVCFWLDGESPVIGMSMRRDKIDNFWFVLRHEIEHVLNRHGQQTEIIDAELEGEQAGTGSSLPEEERIANSAAQDFCVPSAKLESFIARKRPFFYERDVIAFAHLVNRHPGLVVGQMQHRLDRYDYLAKHLVRVRQHVLPEAIFDGWGHTALTA